MIKKIIFLCCLFLSTYNSFSQQLKLPPPSTPSANAPPPPGKQYWEQDYTTHFKMIDPTTGSSFKNKYSEIDGFPFFMEDWKYTLIKLADGRIFDLINTRLNLYTKELHFKTIKEVEMAFAAGYVIGFAVYSSLDTKSIIYEFESGFPKIDNQNQNTFYQVMSKGKVLLLKLTQKQIVINKNDLSGEISKRFVAYEDYYIFSNNQINKLKKDKNFILNLLSDKKNQVEKFSRELATNFKSLKDIILLINVYNSLVVN